MQQKLTRMQEQFEQQQRQQQLAHEQTMRTVSFRHAVDEAAQLKDALGAAESEMTTILAGAIGERTISETADSLNADRERRREQDAEEAAQRREWEYEQARYERELARENARMGHDLEVERLKVQAAVVVAAVNRGLADHQNVEYLISELKSVTKQLEHASASASRQETEQGESSQPPKYSERPKRSARPERPARSDLQADDRVIEAEIVSDDLDARGDEAEPEPREEDLGR
jgi:hypothetical protein